MGSLSPSSRGSGCSVVEGKSGVVSEGMGGEDGRESVWGG